jgi:hypothetical protein
MASLWTFPRVANGLDIGLRLFTRDFQTRLIGQTVHVAEAFSAHKRDIDNFEVSDDELTTFAETLVPVGRLRMSVKVTGAIASSVQGDRIGQTPIERLLDVAPGAHGSLLADLGYAGSVDLAVRFLTKASLRFTVKAIPAPRLGNPTLFEELIRRVNRAQGYWDPETGTV